MRTLSVSLLVLFLLPASARAASVMIHNGLAPPDPANVLDDATHAADAVYVRNVDCPPGWPAAGPADPCPAPGAPTEVEVAEGGAVGLLLVHDTSTARITGGTISNIVRTHQSAGVTMTGGSVLNSIHTLTASTFVWTGGSIAGDLEAHNTSVIGVVGDDFQVDGVPVPFGDLSALTGTLTGTLASGEPIEIVFFQGGGEWAGAVRLVEAPAAPVPALALWSRLVLIAVLVAAPLARMRSA